MPYSRLEYELEVDAIESKRVRLSRKLANKAIDGFQWQRGQELLDKAEQKAKGKLLAVRLHAGEGDRIKKLKMAHPKNFEDTQAAKILRKRAEEGE